MSNMLDLEDKHPGDGQGIRASRLAPAYVLALAVAAAALGWWTGYALLGHAPQAGDQPVSLGQAATAALVAGLLAWVASVVFRRRWRPLALTAACLSLAGPLTLARGSSAAVLMGLHLVVALVLILGLSHVRRHHIQERDDRDAPRAGVRSTARDSTHSEP